MLACGYIILCPFAITSDLLGIFQNPTMHSLVGRFRVNFFKWNSPASCLRPELRQRAGPARDFPSLRARRPRGGSSGGTGAGGGRSWGHLLRPSAPTPVAICLPGPRVSLTLFPRLQQNISRTERGDCLRPLSVSVRGSGQHQLFSGNARGPCEVGSHAPIVNSTYV